MRYISIAAILFMTACSKNFVDKKTVINSGTDLLKLNAEICNKYKSNKLNTFGCGSAISSNLEVSRTKALLNAKVNVADIVGSSILKSEKQSRSETNKGIKSTYKTTEENKILETSLHNYQVVFTKTFKQGNQFRTYTVIKYETQS